MEDLVAPFIADGRLVPVLEDWSPPFSGYHLYYPSRRHPSRPSLRFWRNYAPTLLYRQGGWRQPASKPIFLVTASKRTAS